MIIHFHWQIEDLCRKFQPSATLQWDAAVAALSSADMDVDRAYCSIQCESLQPLYEFIFSDWNEVKATDMERIKKGLAKDEADKELKEVCLYIQCILHCIQFVAWIMTSQSHRVFTPLDLLIHNIHII